MYSVTDISYNGPAETPDREYNIICIVADSDNKPSFLIRKWGKRGTKGSAKIEMFDRSSRAKINLRSEEKNRKQNGYGERLRDSYSFDGGVDAFKMIKTLLPKFEEDHPVFEVLKEIKNYGKAIEPDKSSHTESSEKPSESKPVVQYDSWGTW